MFESYVAQSYTVKLDSITFVDGPRYTIYVSSGTGRSSLRGTNISLIIPVIQNEFDLLQFKVWLLYSKLDQLTIYIYV